MQSKHLDFYFDLSSPYSYLAATQLDALAKKYAAQVAWKPMVLAAVFKAQGNVMPAVCLPKAQYMLKDLARWAEEYGVPFDSRDAAGDCGGREWPVRSPCAALLCGDVGA